MFSFEDNDCDTNIIFSRLEQCCIIAPPVVSHLKQTIHHYIVKNNIDDANEFFVKLRKIYYKCEGVDWYETKILFKVCFVLIKIKQDPTLVIDNIVYFNVLYGFSEEDPETITSLLHFRNMVHVALTFIKAKNHKGEIMEIASRLNGGSLYVRGKGQTHINLYRSKIFEQESGHIPIKKPRIV